MDAKDLDFATRAARAGTRVRVGDTISTVAPIDPSTTFTAESIQGVHDALAPDGHGFAYGRNANPTVVALEEAIASLEEADAVVAFGSGMGAIAAAVQALDLGAGDVIVAADALYGVSRGLLLDLGAFGIETRFVDILDIDSVAEGLADPDVRALYFETIANPLLQVPDVEALAGLARARRVTTIVDNTFATPYLFRPLSAGVDIVVHSATKYIAGHGDVLAGLAAADVGWAERIRARRTLQGGVLSPFDAWLTMRGVRTLPLRMDRQCIAAALLAGWLGRQPWVERVYYPGLADSPFRALAERQFAGRFGAMVSFDLAADRDHTLAFFDQLELITPGTSLGDISSLALYPPLSSHRGLTERERQAAGIGEGLVRLSVGIEAPEDLQADLEGAARRAGLLSGVHVHGKP